MLPEHLAVLVYEIARGVGSPRRFRNECSIISVGHKANVLAVALVRVDQPMLLGNRACLGFGYATEGEERMRELLLRQLPEKISLILGRVSRFFQQISAVFGLLDPCVMSRGNVIKAAFQRRIQ